MNLETIRFNARSMSLKTASVVKWLACSPRVKPRSIESYISIHRNIRHKVLHFIFSIPQVNLYLERKRQSALWI